MDAEALEPNVEPSDPAMEPAEQGAVEPTQPTELSGGDDPSDEKATEPDADVSQILTDLRQENKRLRRGRSEQTNQVQRLVDERAAAVRERDDAFRERDDARVELDRFKIAAEKGLTLEWADRLHGATPDELREDAERLIAQLNPGPPSARTAGFDGGARQSMPQAMTPEAAHNDLLLKAMGRKR